jgi:hypothetical protein
MIWNFDYKNFSLTEFISGCGSVLLDAINLQSEKTKEVAAYRIKICNACPLGKVNGTVCYRDMSPEQEVAITQKAIGDNENILVNIHDFQQKERVKNAMVMFAIREEIKKKTHVISEIDNNPVLGCGCLIKCKVSSLSSSCPAGKWLAII